jgi:hypothetical protein
MAERNRESWFNDKTFLGLYGEKEREYQSGNVTPFIDEELFHQLAAVVGAKKMWEITEEDVRRCEEAMRAHGARKQEQQ